VWSISWFHFIHFNSCYSFISIPTILSQRGAEVKQIFLDYLII
jgi:hypothetical protein